jgi:putative ABC transport system ATP-binding protein
MSDNNIIFELRNVHRRIADKTIIEDFSASFRKGRIYTIIGPSGAGKSSLLRLMNRLDDPDSGSILFHGNDVSEMSSCRLRCKIGFLFQTPYMFPGTVRDNFFYAECVRTEETARHLIELVQLEPEYIDADAESLSVGQKQRVALGRLLATNPEVVLLDEPTSALDPTITEAVEGTIRNIVESTGLTVIMVTHNPDQALRMTGETLLVVKGRLVESGPCEEVINSPRTELGQKYRARQLR